MSSATGSLCFDEYGRAFMILKQENDQQRLTGLDALKSHILVARNVADKLRTSLGPKGMDKMLVTPDGTVVVTNDGATILELMDVDHEVAKLIVSLAEAQDREVGDGTTGVVVLAGALLERASELLDKGVHPTVIAEGYELAARAAAAHLDYIAFNVSVAADDTAWLVKAAKTALSSKIASKCQDQLAEVAVLAVKTTCDLTKENPVLNPNSIVLRGLTGGQIEDTEFVRGVLVQGESQIKVNLHDVKIAVFSGAALQLPKVQTKCQLNIDDMNNYNELKDFVDDWWCKKVFDYVKNAGADLVIYSGKIDESVSNLFQRHGISTIESVSDVEMIAASTKARIIPNVEDLVPEKLGQAYRVRVIEMRVNNEKLFALEQPGRTGIASILVRGSNEMIVEEIKRSLQDALCVVRNLVKDSKVVCGGGAAEISCSLVLQEQSTSYPGMEQLVFQAFADALDSIPMALAENAGMYPLQVLTELKAAHRPTMGVDCMGTGNCDMVSQGIVEGVEGKKHQLATVTQLVSMILKIDDIRCPKDENKE